MFLFGSNENHIGFSGPALHCLGTPVLSGSFTTWRFLLVNIQAAGTFQVCIFCL